MFHKWNIILMIVLALLVLGCNISGRVTTVDGDGIEDVLVTLTGGGGPLTTYTNNEGYYDFLDLQPGIFTVTPTKEGYYYFLPSEKKVIAGTTNINFEQDVGTYKQYFGIFAVWEPTDLTLYNDLLVEPLEMPAQPLVGAFIVDFYDMSETSIFPPYLEGSILLRCKFEGEEGWHNLSTPMSPNMTILHLIGGRMVGYPKYIADEMTLVENNDIWIGSVLKNDRTKLALEFTPDEGVDVSNIIEYCKWGETVFQFVPPQKYVSLIKINLIQYLQPTWEWDPGIVQITFDPDDPWAGLLPINNQSKGLFLDFSGGMGAITETGIWETGN